MRINLCMFGGEEEFATEYPEISGHSVARAISVYCKDHKITASLVVPLDLELHIPGLRYEETTLPN